MSFKVLLMAFCVSFMVFLLVDLIWLKYLAGPFYRTQLDSLLSEQPRILPALLFYVLFVLGNIVFVVKPSLASGATRTMMVKGALYGLISYGTYDLTNYSTLEGWPLSVTVIDLLWGVMISMLVALSGYFTAIYLQRWVLSSG